MEQQFKNTLTALTACSESKDDAVFAEEAPLKENVEVPFERYENTPSYNTVRQKTFKAAYFAVNVSSRSLFHVEKSVTREIKLNRKSKAWVEIK
ncbi:hypothetical protein TNCT_480191 [Trichonephila clavata]|uniref:Uncharacterized protein n=1 Tax=Trichonephila clavata TaxID=2740835 RepID=A0A8X6F3J9_TRICU|nr:hypothetical protein TNCT_480191 [Trichonephila clavata]